MSDEFSMTRRMWMTMRVMGRGVGWAMAMEAVSSTALAHPEWDMEETKTFEEWMADDRDSV